MRLRRMMAPLSPPVPVTLAKDLARALRGGHPWVFRDAVEPAPRLASGTTVELRSREGRPLAVGFWDARSSIAVRIRLTSLGRSIEPRCREVLTRLNSVLGSGLPMEEVVRARKALARMIDNMRRDEESGG